MPDIPISTTRYETSYEVVKAKAQRLADHFGVEYGLRQLNGHWTFSEAAWYALNFKRLGITHDDVELILPTDRDDEEPNSWTEVIQKWDRYDGTSDE